MVIRPYRETLSALSRRINQQSKKKNKQMKSKLMITSAALVMSFAVPASAYVPPPINCNGVSTMMSYSSGCEPTPPPTQPPPYPTKKIPIRQHTYPEHTMYEAVEVNVGLTESLGVSGRYLVFRGVSSGSPYGGFYIQGRNGKFTDGRTVSPTNPVYLTTTRNTTGTALWNGLSQLFNGVWALGTQLLHQILLLF